MKTRTLVRALIALLVAALAAGCLGFSAAEEELPAPVLVSVTEGLKLFDPIEIHLEPFPGAEAYAVEMAVEKEDEPFRFMEEIKYDSPDILFTDWPPLKGTEKISVYVRALAGGEIISSWLIIPIEAENVERPEAPAMTLAFSEEPVTNTSEYNVTISEGYEAFAVYIYDEYKGTYIDTTETGYHRLGKYGDVSFRVCGKKDGVWSLPGEEQIVRAEWADELAAPEIEILTDPVYVKEPIQVRLVNADERTEYYSVQLYQSLGQGRYRVATKMKTRDTEFWLTDWNENSEAGDYMLLVECRAGDYNPCRVTGKLIALEERPDEEKVVITPEPGEAADDFDDDEDFE